MNKNLELNPEWVLENLTDTIAVKENVKIAVFTGSQIYAHVIQLALKIYEMPYETAEIEDDNLNTFYGFEFNIEDIKEECPIFYKKINELKLENSKSLYKQIN